MHCRQLACWLPIGLVGRPVLASAWLSGLEMTYEWSQTSYHPVPPVRSLTRLCKKYLSYKKRHGRTSYIVPKSRIRHVLTTDKKLLYHALILGINFSLEISRLQHGGYIHSPNSFLAEKTVPLWFCSHTQSLATSMLFGRRQSLDLLPRQIGTSFSFSHAKWSFGFLSMHRVAWCNEKPQHFPESFPPWYVLCRHFNMV